MKRLFLLTALLIAATSMKAQEHESTYNPIPNHPQGWEQTNLSHTSEDYVLDNTIWIHYYQTLSIDWTPFQLAIKGDTIVNGTTYHKVIDCTHIGFPIEGECCGGIRIDEDNKWYYKSFYSGYFGQLPHSPVYLLEGPIGSEYLLYDFSLTECEDFHFIGQDIWNTLYEIDEIEIDGTTRRRFWFSTNCESCDYYQNWIEGIGANWGLLHPLQTYPLTNGSRYHLFEVWQDEELIYKDPYFYNFETGSEWYYEILNDDNSITYQHLECVGDTIIQGERPKVLVRSNTQYDRDETEVTHEYIYMANGIVYWWNNDLQEFTTLYNFNATVGSEWEIKVGLDSISLRVDGEETIENEGRTYRMLHVSDENDLFSGDIVCGIGHLTSFFPERLMCRNKNYRVEGLRCYWMDEELIFKYGNEDCDVILSELQNIDKLADVTFAVYPNPANNVLIVEMCHGASLPDQTEYSITNPLGQTLLQGNITAETQLINIESLHAGLYFISVGNMIQRFVVK